MVRRKRWRPANTYWSVPHLKSERKLPRKQVVPSQCVNGYIAKKATNTDSKKRTCWTKKKSSPASTLFTLLGCMSILSLHAPMRVSGGNGILALRAGSSGFPAQLAPRWNVYGREVDAVVKRRARGVLRAIRLASAGVYNLKFEGRYLQGGPSIFVVCSKFNSHWHQPFTSYHVTGPAQAFIQF
jgi:hypothetical protein